jgi:NAD(P)-dependent dehydrogenase (short-subunit alcohol dehydrogenase family)
MIEAVSLAEAALREPRGRRLPTAAASKGAASLADVAPILRGALAQSRPGGAWRRVVLDHRGGPLALAYAGGAKAARYSQAGPVTPDHVLRLKPWPLLLSAPQAGDLPTFAEHARAEIAAFGERYRTYFERHRPRANAPKTMLDPGPRWALVPGLGLFGIGGTAREARIAADIGETTAATVLNAEAIGRFESISEADVFDVEYWSLEQAKLGNAKPKALAGQVAVVTGGGGVIGAAIAQAFAAEGAELAVLDRDATAAGEVAGKVGGLALTCDVTRSGEVEAAMAAVVAAFGGVDIVVSNAGAAFLGGMAEAPDSLLRESFELNFFAHQHVARAAVKVMLQQKTGGALLFNASKQPLNPAAGFGLYGTAKAALLALMRQYAVEHGADGVRSNAVNADRIRSGLLTPALVAERSAARGVSEADYMSGNLLGREVTAQDVAQAFLSLALAEKTTAAVLTVDGGNIAAAVR